MKCLWSFLRSTKECNFLPQKTIFAGARLLQFTSEHEMICVNFRNIFTYTVHNFLKQSSLLGLRTTVPFVTAHLEIFHCTHHPVIPKSILCFTFCSTLNALSKRTSK